MAIHTIYCDESGFTGYNLLDQNQPVFSIASTDINPKEAEKLLKESFPKYNGKEFKFSNLWQHRRKDFVFFSEQVAKSEKKIKTWIIDKKYAVITKIVDMLIEPLYTSAGFDFYAGGFCWKYTNLIHYSLSTNSDALIFDKLVMSYQSFSRNPNPNSLNELDSLLNKLEPRIDDRNKNIWHLIQSGVKHFHNFHDLDNFHGTDELHLTTLLGAVVDWRKCTIDDIAVVHDKSANFFRRKKTWEKITGPNVLKHLHNLGDGSKVQYPLRVISTDAVDSKDNYSIQLCDVLAGFVNKLYTAQVDGKDQFIIDDIIPTGIGNLQVNGIYFRSKFPDPGLPNLLDGHDAVDDMMRIIGKI